MSKTQKVIDRLLSYPKDFTWDEMIIVLNHLGYKKLPGGKTGGSRRKFADASGHLIILHEPHPANLLKQYQLKEVIGKLRETGKLNDRPDST